MNLPKMWSLFGADHLPYRLLLLARMIDRQTTRQLQQQFDMTLAEWRVLAFICAAGPATASTVGQSGGIDRAEISRAVSKLESKELVTRQPDPGNRRRLVISPTPSGSALFVQLRADRRAFFRSVVADISIDDRAIVETAMERMAQRVRA
jgi:DNA-binding MarR family transcriptional regulator